MHRASFNAAHIGLACAVTLLALMCAELVLRAFHPVPVMGFELDETVLFRNRPGGSRVFSPDPGDKARRVTSTFDQHGLRGNSLHAKQGRRRIGVYGDSFIASDFAEREKTFVARLETRLSQAGQPVQMLNLGVPAYGPDQIALRLESEISALQLDAVVVGLFADNDFGDLMRNKLFRLGTDGQLVRNRPRLAASLRARFEAPTHRQPFHVIRLASQGAHRLLRWLGSETSGESQRVDHLASRRSEYVDYVVQGNDEVTSLFEDTEDIDLIQEPDAPGSVYKVALMKAVLKRMKATADAAKVPLFAVVIPGSKEARPTSGKPSRDELLESLLRDVGIAHLNLAPHFSRRERHELYLPVDQHWSETGQELAAELVAAAMTRRTTDF